MPKTKMPKIEIVTTSSRICSFRVKNSNGEIIVQSGIYTTKKLCIKAICELTDAMWHYDAEKINLEEIYGGSE